MIDITLASTKDTTQSHPTLLRKVCIFFSSSTVRHIESNQDQRPKPYVPPYTSKHFEFSLSPIIEDTHTFANTLRGPKGVAISDMVDSTESSYGELIQRVRFFSTQSLSEYTLDVFFLLSISEPTWHGLENWNGSIGCTWIDFFNRLSTIFVPLIMIMEPLESWRGRTSR